MSAHCFLVILQRSCFFFCPGTLFLLTEKQFRSSLDGCAFARLCVSCVGCASVFTGHSGWGPRMMVGESLQTLIQLLCLPLSFRTTSGHAYAAPWGIERPSYLAEDLVSQASNSGPSSHTLSLG